MESKKLLRNNFALAWPLAINALLIQSMLIIDTVLIAPLGGFSVAAIGIASAIVALALALQLAISNGIQLIVSRAHGADSRGDQAVAFWAGILLNLFIVLVFFIGLSLFGAAVVAGLTKSVGIQKLALAYLSIVKYVVLITAITQICTAFYNGRGNTQIALRGFLIEIPINAFLSYFLIYGVGGYSGLGLVGAAWGSLVAVILRAIYFCTFLKFDREVDIVCPSGRAFRHEFRSLISEVFPVAANFIVLFVGASIYQLLYAQLDLYSFVAIALIFPWIRIGTQVVSAWAQATAINISQSLGSSNSHHLKAFTYNCIRIGVCLSVFVAALFFLLSRFVYLIYPEVDAEAFRSLAVIAPLYILLPIIRGYNSVSGNILRAFGESQRILKLHLITQWMISLPICAILILYFDVSVFWAFAMMPVEELLKVSYFYRLTRNKFSSSYR